MKVLIVTGSVCSGKTTLSKILAEKLGFKYVDVNDIVKEMPTTYDKKRKCKVVDEKKLVKKLASLVSNSRKDKEKGVVIDSHMSHYMDKKMVDLCVVTKCDLKVMEKRLKARKYSKLKVKENLEAEVFNTCLSEAKEAGHNIIVINTTKDFNRSYVVRRVRSKV